MARNSRGTQRLKRYWAYGEGATKIRWGTPGDFNRCVRRVSKYMPRSVAKGYCAKLHKRVVGKWPGRH